MIERIEELNNNIYKLFSECYENQNLISKEQLELIKKALYEGYSMEYELLKLDMEKEFEIAKHEKEQRNYNMIPKYKRHWYSFWKRHPNRAAFYIDEAQDIEADKYFIKADELNAQSARELEEMQKADESDDQNDEVEGENPPDEEQTGESEPAEEPPEKKPKKRRKREKVEPAQEVLEQIAGQMSMAELDQQTKPEQGDK